ncbi:oxidoreductase [Mycolicibacterium canariasense]|uniref:Oxidoreductase n=1 Tax=Mycolicibacterium canariasense TaxID=228230 RepID=A0A117I9L2_MYCCR|nr:LLM class F420-dependent oxidoreductase [Mycolicibacterium canariasense]MCV7209450.1 LLM class F420-dependent oxidoreductase [Mycolicibacterium canariasense]ORV05748.1 LLM class F420-dependent oxidoreductase [Mycolicibacterium canariasense]GAS95014.1 oxidoreductase [Mycolicibacterium canariasense]
MGNGARLSIDRGMPSDLDKVPAAARALEAQGYDGCWTGEVNHDPFLPLLLAAEHTSRMQLGTSVAVAFARNPMLVANLGWDLQAYSRGRFILGLGTQVQAHIEKRFGMPWGQPVRRMREFVAAVQAIWSCWQHHTRLSFEGEFYTHKLMTPMFTPEPQPYGVPKIFIAAVGDGLTHLCGEVADGLIAHAFTTKRYLDEVTIPALLAGLTRAGRHRDAFEVSCPVFVVTGETEEQFAAAAAAQRKEIAFYGSTPAYRAVLDVHGWGELHTELHRLSRLGQWDTMADLVDDEVLAAFAVVAPLSEVADALRQRCAGVIDRVLPGFPPGLPEPAIAGVLADLREQPKVLRCNAETSVRSGG